MPLFNIQSITVAWGMLYSYDPGDKSLRRITDDRDRKTEN